VNEEAMTHCGLLGQKQTKKQIIQQREYVIIIFLKTVVFCGITVV
jgi:hypothetical protein